MANIAIVGTQWGDEGKGKVVDLLAEYADIVARFQALAYEEKARESDKKGFLGLGARPSEKAVKQWRKAATAFRKAATTSPTGGWSVEGDATGLGQAFQAGRDVDAIAENVVALDDPHPNAFDAELAGDHVGDRIVVETIGELCEVR